ncbi:uncharacterized protein LOC131162771 [Malania oleifera]|uniref:uncharacterized protein LOC131162771 n=1 Tax=Malania oleifera TaxID=397392 RepID=UPI0025ADED92|nr:uncharacterized protein LOC131162771 [Malania oleifera]
MTEQASSAHARLDSLYNKFSELQFDVRANFHILGERLRELNDEDIGEDQMETSGEEEDDLDDGETYLEIKTLAVPKISLAPFHPILLLCLLSPICLYARSISSSPFLFQPCFLLITILFLLHVSVKNRAPRQRVPRRRRPRRLPPRPLLQILSVYFSNIVPAEATPFSNSVWWATCGDALSFVLLVNISLSHTSAIADGSMTSSSATSRKAITALKKGAYLLKYGRRGKPKFCSFRLSNMGENGYGSMSSYLSKLYGGYPPPSTLDMLVSARVVGKGICVCPSLVFSTIHVEKSLLKL